MPKIVDISGERLTRAMDFQGWEDDSEDGSDATLQKNWEDAILNILEANDFDAIPLVSEPEGYPVRIARRRYHDGDHSDLFVVGIEEVEVFPAESSIIEVVFSVLSSEHHIALIGDEDSVVSIVTLDTLASPRSRSPALRRYLDQKVADIASLTGEQLPADLGRSAFEGIRGLASLIDSERAKVSDRDFTQMVIDTLVILQPLKGHSRTDVDMEESHHWHSSRETEDVVASDFCNDMMTGVMGGGSLSVVEEARDSLGLANNYSQLLFFSAERRPTGIFWNSDGSWKRTGASLWRADEPIEDVLIQLAQISRDPYREPAIVLDLGEGGYGIVTKEEASGEVPVFWMLKRLAVLENQCKDWLIDKGIDELREYKTRWGERIPTENASFGQILREHEEFSDAVGGKEEITALTNFRNQLVHKVVARRNEVDLHEMGRALDAKAGLERLISS